MDKYKILDALAWFFIIIAVIFFIWMVIGGSPTFDQFATTVLAGFLLKLYSKVDRVDKELTELHVEFKNHGHEVKT